MHKDTVQPNPKPKQTRTPVFDRDELEHMPVPRFPPFKNHDVDPQDQSLPAKPQGAYIMQEAPMPEALAPMPPHPQHQEDPEMRGPELSSASADGASLESDLSK